MAIITYYEFVILMFLDFYGRETKLYCTRDSNFYHQGNILIVKIVETEIQSKAVMLWEASKSARPPLLGHLHQTNCHTQVL